MHQDAGNVDAVIFVEVGKLAFKAIDVIRLGQQLLNVLSMKDLILTYYLKPSNHFNTLLINSHAFFKLTLIYDSHKVKPTSLGLGIYKTIFTRVKGGKPIICKLRTRVSRLYWLEE